MHMARASHNTNRLIKLRHLTAHLDKLRRNCFQMLRNDILYHHVAAGDRCRTHKCTCLDLVRDDRIFGSMQLVDAADADHVGSGTLDIGSHAV